MTTEEPHPTPVSEWTVVDGVLAKIAAFAASDTPGVARLQPHLSQTVTRAAAGVARRATRRGAPRMESRADPAAVAIERVATGELGLVVRVVATGNPPVITTATELHRRITEDLRRLAGIRADVCVQVLDVEAGA